MSFQTAMNGSAPAEKLALRPYQTEALLAIDEGLGRGVRRPLVALPTGCGKTVIFANLIADRGGRALVLAHREELLQQAADKLRSVDSSLQIGVVRAGRDDVDAPVVVASVQTLARQRRLDRMPRQFETVVVDEAHHASADSYVRIIDYLTESPLILGVTATPQRTDNKHLGDVWNEVVYHRTLLDMIRAGYLADMRGIRVSLDVDLSKVRTSHGDFVSSALGEAMEGADAPTHVVGAWKEHAADRKTIVFTPTVDLAHAMAGEFRGAGVAAEALDGTTPDDERAAILERLHTGETQLVANVAVLSEGFDEPSVDCIVMASPTKSQIAYIQRVGRGSRLYPGKRDCLVLDVAGVSSRLSLLSLPKLFGLGKEPKENETVAEAAAREEQEYEAQSGKLAAEHVDLFSRQALNWLQMGERFILDAGQYGRLELGQPFSDSEGWVVVRRPKRSSDDPEPTAEVLANAPDLGYAQGIAEDFARENGLMALVASDAPWRGRSPSTKQLDLLKKLGVTIPPELTKGEASDLIAVHINR